MASGIIYANPDSSYVFYNMKNLVDINGLENYNTLTATNMSWMFSFIEKIEELDLNEFNTKNVKDMSHMFQGYAIQIGTSPTTYYDRIKIIKIEDFDTSKVTNMSSMFGNLINLEALDLSKWDTSNVIDMSSMFYKTGMRTNTFSIEGLDNWDVSNVTDMSSMF